jgi:hypothetical protein
MRASLCIALPVLILVLGVGGIVAINSAASEEGQATSEYASQPIKLSTEQERLIWQRVNDQPVAAAPPLSSLPVRPGQAVPNDIPLQPLPDNVTSDIPSLKGYAYAIVQDRLMIVNPSDKTVGRVIDTNQRSIR